jgi:hypothetical protein
VPLFDVVTCGSLENMAYYIPHPSTQDEYGVIQGCKAAEVCQWIQAVYSSACVSKTTLT